MHIVIIHGYILDGTGSNIYTTNLAKTFKIIDNIINFMIHKDIDKSNRKWYN